MIMVKWGRAEAGLSRPPGRFYDRNQDTRAGALSSPGPLLRLRSSVESFRLKCLLLGELDLRGVLGAVLELNDELTTDAGPGSIRLPVVDVLASISVIVQIAGADGDSLLYGICRKPCVAANFPG